MGSLIWYEARGEPLEAQRGVLDVAINRARLSHKTICDVIKAPGQFQWTKYHNPGMVDRSREALVESVSSEPRILRDEKWKWFYSINPAPSWAHKMTCRMLGKHLHFCREKS